MLRNLLVPLDGSALAEAALPAAVCLAQSADAMITLLHVIEHNAPRQIHHERHLTQAGEAEAYLQDIAERGVPAGLRVERHVHANETIDVAKGIVQHIAELNPDLILMSTHGRTSPARWMFGSIAQQVVAMGSTPVLLIPPRHRIDPSLFGNHLLLVPLDGDPAHEQSLCWATELARACGAKIQLLTVVHTVRNLRGERAAAASMLPGTMAAVLEIEQQNAEEYLQGVLPELHRTGITAGWMVRRGKRVVTILEVARELNADVIVLSTHGKAGTEAFWSASVGPRVAMESHLPVLLVPIK
jgi:nucleotide-binding universal stress UspA family protein